MFDQGFGSAVGSEGSEEALLFFVVWLVEVTMRALVEVTIFLPMSQLVAVCTECPSGEFLWYLFEFPEERECINLVEALYKVGL